MCVCRKTNDVLIEKGQNSIYKIFICQTVVGGKRNQLKNNIKEKQKITIHEIYVPKEVKIIRNSWTIWSLNNNISLLEATQTSDQYNKL